MSYTLDDVRADFIHCELCDVYTPRAYCEECDETTCEYCLDAYGCEEAGGIGHP